jgi:hypothetical protein
MPVRKSLAGFFQISFKTRFFVFLMLTFNCSHPVSRSSTPKLGFGAVSDDWEHWPTAVGELRQLLGANYRVRITALQPPSGKATLCHGHQAMFLQTNGYITADIMDCEGLRSSPLAIPSTITARSKINLETNAFSPISATVTALPLAGQRHPLLDDLPQAIRTSHPKHNGRDVITLPYLEAKDQADLPLGFLKQASVLGGFITITQKPGDRPVRIPLQPRHLQLPAIEDFVLSMNG